MVTRTDDAGPNENICVSCGLCCDGTLFLRVPLFDEDPPSIVEQLPAMRDSDGRQFFRLPCPHLCEMRCSIYQSRPTTCRNFHCKLLLQEEAGEVSASEARAVIREAKQLIAAVQVSDPEARFYEARKRIRQELAEASQTAHPRTRPAIGRRLLNIIALDEFLGRRFRKDKSKQAD